MNIHGILVQLDNNVTRKYTWSKDYLTLEELLAYIASREKFPDDTEFKDEK